MHAGVDGNRRAMVIIGTGGQRHDGVVLPDVLEELRVPKPSGAGRPRVCPDVVGPAPDVSTFRGSGPNAKTQGPSLEGG